ncbi:VgrG-related protein [Chloroflexales bacterium ZM16-3]|nr:VgrG-related protein [Chloroflexales bacterium ZM16-3]
MSDKARMTQCYVTLNDNDAPEELLAALESITVESSLHLPDVATLVIHDPKLAWIDADTLDPGVKVSIWATDGASEEQIFDGEIVEIEPDFDDHTHHLVVRAFDRLHRLGHIRQVRSFTNMTDSDLMRKLAEEAGLQAKATQANEVRPYLIQANTSNLEFLRTRAAALGNLLFVEGETLCCEPLAAEGKPVELQWGAGLVSFRPHLTTAGQLSKVTARGWNPDTREEIIGEAETGQGAPHIGDGRSGGELVRSAFKLQPEALISHITVRTQADAERLAQAVADQHAGRYVEADGVCVGNPAIIAGTKVRISAVGDRFGGEYLVTSALHRHSGGSYQTEFTISGLNPATLLARLLPRASATEGALPMIGIVTDNQDPNGLGRVKVRFPYLSSEHTSDWARVVVPGGGGERGLQLIPEINDEVLVAFELGDINYPYIIGGLWNKLDVPPRPTDTVVKSGKVRQRLFRSRTGHLLVFDDDPAEGGVCIADREGNTIHLKSKEKRLEITIKGDAAIKVGTEGQHPLVVESSGDLTLKAGGDLALDAAGSVSIKGKKGIAVDSRPKNVDINGTFINLN